MAKYLTQEGVQLLINDYNNKINLKADKSQLANYATKTDLENIDIPEVDLTNYAEKSDLANYAEKSEIPNISNLATKNEVAAAVAGLENYDDTALTQRVTTLENKTTRMYRFKGNVDNLEALQQIQNPEDGDVYNLRDTGMNVGWTGTEWDDFSPTVDLSEYARLDDVQALTLSELNAILYSGKSAVVADTQGLAAMLANNQDEVEITLVDEVALTEKIVVPEGKKVTLNLGDNTISSTARGLEVEGELEIQGGAISAVEKPIAVYNGGKVTIDGTDISSTQNSGISVYGQGSEVVMNSGSVEGLYGLTIFHGGTLVINDGTSIGTDGAAISGNGSKYFDTVQRKPVANPNANTIEQLPVNVVINGGTFEGQSSTPGDLAAGIYWPSGGSITINKGDIISDGAGIVMRGGHITIGDEARVIANGTTGVVGKVGDARQVVGPYAVVYDKNSLYPAYETLELTIAANATLQGTDGDIQYIMPNGETAQDANVNDLRG